VRCAAPPGCTDPYSLKAGTTSCSVIALTRRLPHRGRRLRRGPRAPSRRAPSAGPWAHFYRNCSFPESLQGQPWRLPRALRATRMRTLGERLKRSVCLREEHTISLNDAAGRSDRPLRTWAPCTFRPTLATLDRRLATTSLPPFGCALACPQISTYPLILTAITEVSGMCACTPKFSQSGTVCCGCSERLSSAKIAAAPLKRGGESVRGQRGRGAEQGRREGG